MDSNIETQIFLVLFFGVFQWLGAIFLGLGVRQMLAGKSQGVGQVIFGACFAGLGSLASAASRIPANRWGFVVGMAGTIFIALVAMFAPQEFLERFGTTALAIGLGAFALFTGGFVLTSALRAAQEIWFAVIFGACWGLVGLACLLTGLGALLRGQPLRLKQTGTGRYTRDSSSNRRKRKKD